MAKKSLTFLICIFLLLNLCFAIENVETMQKSDSSSQDKELDWFHPWFHPHPWWLHPHPWPFVHPPMPAGGFHHAWPFPHPPMPAGGFKFPHPWFHRHPWPFMHPPVPSPPKGDKN